MGAFRPVDRLLCSETGINLLHCCIFFLVRFAFTRQHCKAYQTVFKQKSHVSKAVLLLVRVHLFMFLCVIHQDGLTSLLRGLIVAL